MKALAKPIAALGIGLAGLAAGSHPALAQGASTPHDWTGVYAGAQGGFAWADSHIFFVDFGTETDPDGDGGFGGPQVGFNFQIDSVVLGLEGDISFGNIFGSADCPAATFSCEFDLDRFATLRGRVGIAVDRIVSVPVLIYATGGGAWGELDVFAVAKATGVTFGEEKGRWGYAVGGGVEVALTDNISFKVEYLRVDLGEDTHAIGDPSPDEVDFTMDVVRVVISFNFGGP